MKMSMRISITMLAMIAALFACSEENDDEQLVSVNGSTESHNAGEVCMNCHKSGGSGEGIFVVAGTVYNSGKTAVYPNATIRLYTGPNATGSQKGVIEVDGKGNFYTTASTDFGTGLYVVVEGNTSTNHMNSIITNGNCNQCHNASKRIWTE